MSRALIVVDVQNDFTQEGGSMFVGGDSHDHQPITVINKMIDEFPVVIKTRDWHPIDHVSFGIFPRHCVQNTFGAEFDPDLAVSPMEIVISKGTQRDTDCFSAFGVPHDPCCGRLEAFLKAIGVFEVTVCGAVLEYCVRETALSALKAGFKTTVVTEGIYTLDETKQDTHLNELKSAGIIVDTYFPQ